MAQGLPRAISKSKSRGAGEERAVNSIDDRLGADLLAAEESSVETLDGILAACDTIEFKVNVALGIRI